MSFSLICPVVKQDAALDLDAVEARLRDYFSNILGWEMVREERPFDDGVFDLLMLWPEWGMRIACEEGEGVREDAVEMARYAHPSEVAAIAGSTRRLRVLFGDDDEKFYTNQIMHMMEFLEDAPELRVFDPQRKEFVD